MWLGSGLIGVVLPSETPSVKPDDMHNTNNKTKNSFQKMH